MITILLLQPPREESLRQLADICGILLERADTKQAQFIIAAEPPPVRQLGLQPY